MKQCNEAAAPKFRNLFIKTKLEEKDITDRIPPPQICTNALSFCSSLYMTATDFGLLLRHSTRLFGELLARNNCEDSADIRGRILAFFSQLAGDDDLAYREHSSLESRGADSEAGIRAFTIGLYDNYIAAARTGKQSGLSPTDEEVIFWLMGGCFSIECYFVIGGDFAIWNAHRQDFLIMHISDGNPHLRAADNAHLLSLGSVFINSSEARRNALRRGPKRLD